MPPLSHSFPPAAAECRPGDHLIRGEADGSCRVYRVKDIVALERLVPSATRPIALTAEADLRDSMAPAYAGEPYLLLDFLEPVFRDADEAEAAVGAGSLSIGARDLLRPWNDYPAASTRVVSTAGDRLD